MFTKHVIEQGVNLYTRHTDQFKTVNFAIKFNTNLTEEKAAQRSVLANVLENSNGRYKTEGELRKKLDDLYGTVLYTDVAKRGANHILSLNIECVNDEYLNATGVFEGAFELLQTVVFEPNFVDGQFNEAIVNREKRTVIERIRSQYDNKTSYAQKRMLEHLRPNSAVSTSANGSEKTIEQLDVASITNAYHHMISNDSIDIYVVGHIDESAVVEKIKELFPFKSRPSRQQHAFQTDEHQAPEKPQRIKEQQKMQQGKLHLAFSTPVSFGHKDYTKMQVTNGVFGAFPHSKLFMNVREKESMAYYASSSYSSHYGLLYAMAGIEAELADKAVALIEEQLVAMQNGEITDLEMEQTIALLSNSIRSAFDSARGQIEIYDQYKEIDEDFSANKLIDEWATVTKQDVQEMAATMQLEIVYLLSGKETISNE